MNTAAVSVFRAALAPRWNTIKRPSAVLRKLSLNAEKNWHQNSGAKRRGRSSGDDGVEGSAMGIRWLGERVGSARGNPGDATRKRFDTTRRCPSQDEMA